MRAASSHLLVLFLATLAHTEGGCPSSWGSPRKDVICYFSGKRAASTLDACLCTHLIYNSIGLNAEGNLIMSKEILSDMESFRTQNPSLKVIASLGGESFDAETFSSLITEKDRLDNLTSSINSLYSEGTINGIEIDWEWPVKEGGKKDRVKLIRYARINWFQHRCLH